MTVRQGDCDFGGTARRVRVIDGNSNLAVNDMTRLGAVKGRMAIVRSGDTVAIDLGDGSFTGEIVFALCGHPVLVDGKWYTVKVSADQGTVTATPIAGGSGEFQIAHDKWTMTLASRNRVFVLAGGAEPVSVPEGLYQIIEYSQTIQPARGKRPARLGSTNAGAKPAVVRVKAGQTANVAAGDPLVASIKAKVRGRKVTMDFAVRDAAGLAIDYVQIPPNGQRPTPKVKVLDTKGNIVHEGTFEYG